MNFKTKIHPTDGYFVTGNSSDSCASTDYKAVGMTFLFHTLRLWQNGHHFANGIVKLILLYENSCILVQISL